MVATSTEPIVRESLGQRSRNCVWSMSNQRPRRLVLVVQALLLSVTLVAAAPVAAAQPPAAANPAVITTWNEIAVTTVTGPAPNGAGMAGPTAFNYFAFTQIAATTQWWASPASTSCTGGMPKRQRGLHQKQPPQPQHTEYFATTSAPALALHRTEPRCAAGRIIGARP